MSGYADEPEFVGLEDGWNVADEGWYAAQNGDTREAAAPAEYVFVPFAEFADLDEPGATPLVAGPDGEAAIAEGSDCLAYGDGGVGKTTVLLDQALHFAAGVAWHGILTPARPLRIGWVEAESPRPLFRVKLRRRFAAWDGPAIDDRLVVLERPWGRIDLRVAAEREKLAEQVAELRLDLVVIGPLRAVGMEGAGNLGEVNAFLEFLRDVRERSGRRVAFLVVHHESKAGAVSGAWEGATDLLVHVQSSGHGELRLYWQKARHSSALHQATHRLAWGPGNAGDFALEDEPPPRAERTWNELAEYVLEHGGTGWNAVDKSVTGEATYLRRRRDEMLAEGLLVDVGKGQKFELWHRDDPARPTTLDETASDLRRGSDAVASLTGSGEADKDPRRRVAAYRRRGERRGPYRANYPADFTPRG